MKLEFGDNIDPQRLEFDSSSRAEMEEFSHVELEFLRLELKKYLKNKGNKSVGRRRHDLENKI